jgi:hypothetical protein
MTAPVTLKPFTVFDPNVGDRALQGPDIDSLIHAVANTLTAAGTTRADALAVTARVNHISTAAGGTGVVLPAMTANEVIWVINDGVSSIQVYAPGSVTIDGTAGATGVALAAGGRAAFVAYTAALLGSISAGITNPAGTFTTLSASGIVTLTSIGAALVAAGTTRADALALTAQTNRLGTVGAGTGVILPAAVPGVHIHVFNDGANAAQVYGAGSNTIDGVAGSTGVPLTNTKRAIFFCVSAGAYESAQLGAVSA